MEQPRYSPDGTTPAVSSAMSSVKVHTSRRLGNLLSRLSPSKNQLTLQEKPTAQVLETERPCPETAVVPSRVPEKVFEDPKPDPVTPTKRIGPKLSRTVSNPRSRYLSLSKLKRRSSSRLRQLEGISKAPKQESPPSPLVNHRSGATVDSHQPTSLTGTISKDVMPEPTTPSDRARGGAGTPEQSNGAQSTENAIDSLQWNQRPTMRRFFRSEEPLGYVVATTGDVTQRTAVKRNDVGTKMAAPHKYPPEVSGCSTRCCLAVIPCAVAALLAALLLFLAHRAERRVVHATASATWYDDIEDDARTVCSNLACQEVVALLAQTAAPGVEPCEDFYRHVCGKWQATPSDKGDEAPQPASYAHSNRRSFIARVHRSLERLTREPSRCAPRNCRMAHFYASCSRFAANQAQRQPLTSADEVLQQAGIERQSWHRAPTIFALLERAVSSCLRTGLVSALSARRAAPNDIFLDVGESLDHVFLSSQRQDSPVRRFVHDSLAQFLPTAGKEYQDAILALDVKVEDIRKTLDLWVHRFRRVWTSELPEPLSVFPSLDDGYSAHSSVLKNWRKSLYSRALDKIADVTKLLSTVNLSVAGVYLLLLTASHVVKYAYLLQSTHGSDEELLQQVCVRATAQHFALRFLFWLASTVETPEARFYLDEMVADLKRSAENVTRAAAAFRPNISELVAMPLGTAFLTRSAEGNQEEPALDVDFPLSIIQLSRAPLAEGWLLAEAAARQQLRGDIVLWPGPGTTMTVPSLFLAADLMHADISEPSLDYSTVGVHFLLAWATKASTAERQNNASAKNLTAYERCTADHAAASVGVELDEDALRLVLFLPWVLNVALQSSTNRSQAGVQDRVVWARRRLFFRRFCRTTCGDDVLAKVCQYGVLHSEAFVQAFDCSRPPLRSSC